MRIEEATQTKDGTPWQFFMDCGAYVYGTLHYRESIILGKWIRNGSPIGAFFFPPNTIYRIYSDTPIPEGMRLDLHDWRDEIPWGCLRDEIQWVARGSARGWIGTLKKPSKGADTWWIRDVTNSWSLSGVKMPEGPADWREAIARRPDDKT